MLAYNFKKHSFQKSDHVREILAKLDAKQSKTGLSLYTQQQNSTPSTPGDLPNNEEKSSFPNLKRARKKAQKRITTDSVGRHSNQVSNIRSKNIPHRLPGPTVNLPPVSRGIPKQEERQPASNIPEQQFDKEKLDINLNPFGYNRKTLAFQTRKINYVVEWPETWPFKITSFQRKKVLPKNQKWSRPVDTASSRNNPEPPAKEDERSQPSMNADLNKARILAPVDHPVKQTVISNSPYVESSLLKRAARKPLPKESENRFVLRSQDKDLEFASRRIESSKNEDQTSQKCLPSAQSPLMPEISREQIDSCPPSTPVPSSQDPVPDEQEQCEGEQNPISSVQEPRPNGQKPQRDQSIDHEDVDQETSSLLNDIVNQIISEAKPPTI